MSISQDSGAVIVCREVFDEASHPSNEEVLDYARRLGIDPDAEPHLLDLAREGLMAPLPKGWTPCHDEATGAWYYYHAGTRTTTWEHPLDSKNRAIVERAREATGTRQQSLDDDSKTTAKELESHEEATLPRDGKLPTCVTKIPTKLAPLRKSSLDSVRRRDGSHDRNSRRNNDVVNNQSRLDFPGVSSGGSSSNTSSLMTDRASRDYTNIIFQDPKFYETPRLLDSPERELKLREIVERSESMSPRYEKDWQQLSGKFTNDESNVIDIDKLTTFATDNRAINVDKLEMEKHPRNLSQQRELTLSGGGSIYLKSNRSRDATPCQESGKIDDFSLANEDRSGDPVLTIGERPKSILRDKPTEDDERPNDEERKSVRFDLEKLPDEIKFTFTSFDDDDDDDEDENDENPDCEDIAMNIETDIPCNSGLRKSESFYAGLQRIESQRLIDRMEKHSGHAWSMFSIPSEENENDISETRNETEKIDEKDIDSIKVTSSMIDNPEDQDSSVQTMDNDKKIKKVSETCDEKSSRSRLIGRRFVVENVTENQHRIQTRGDEVKDKDSPVKKFLNVRNIDIFSKSETESQSSLNEDAKSSVLDEIRRSKEAMLESMKRTDMRAKLDLERERHEAYHMIKLRHDLETVNAEQKRGRQRRQNCEGRISRKDEEWTRRDAETRLETLRRELEANFAEEKLRLETEMTERMEELRRNLARQETEEIEKLMTEMNETRTINLTKVRNELEICYEKERQDILENLKVELDQRKRELLQYRNQEMEKLNEEHEREMSEERVVRIAEREMSQRNTEKIESMRQELDKEFDDLRNELRCQQREKVTKITEDHEKCLAEILKDFRVDEGLARKVYKQRLDEIRSDFSRDTDKEAKKQAERVVRQETADYEKIRCEKRLLEDKYKTLKDKYSKLKNDVRLAVERRSKRKEGNATTSETEKSTSARTRTDPSDQKASPMNTRSSSVANTGHPRNPTIHQSEISSINKSQMADDSEIVGSRSSAGQKMGCHGTNVAAGGGGDCSSRSSVKFESDDATTASETVNSNILKNKRKTFARRSSSSVKSQNNNNNQANVTDNPVENIRKQLEKLEDLGDQLPSNETAYTLRYPFQDKAPANASSELEFFRHRIHVERDSVKRAREALRVQRSAFQSRQRAWKQKSVRATLEQLVQEERELSDMEVSLHRTRSLLGEKVIYLRHLEQSLERVASAKRNESEPLPLKNDEMTLSDMSSASSGFSSTDIATDTFIDKPDHYQESTEIIASLENLNSEIREIWGVLNKRQDNNIPPPPTLMYSDLGWLPFQHLTTQSSNVQGFGTPNIQSNILSQLTGSHPPTTTTQNIIAQYGPNSGFTTSVGTVERGTSSLIERTRHMRDWLRQARMESTDLISPGQATL